MAREIPTTEPRVFVEGMTWEWDKTLSEFSPSDGWQLNYFFRSLTATGEDITAAWATEVTADGETFEVRVPFGDTEGLTPGAWELIGWVTDGTKKHEVYHERVNVLPAPTTAGAESFAHTQLAAIEAAIAGKVLTADQKRVQINGRSIEYLDATELERWHAHYALLVELERDPHARLRRQVRFTRA